MITTSPYTATAGSQAHRQEAGGAWGLSWPPRFYTCRFCRREFRSAQALGGHMNVHRRDRARLRGAHSPKPTAIPNPNPNFSLTLLPNPNPSFNLNIMPPPNPNPNPNPSPAPPTLPLESKTRKKHEGGAILDPKKHKGRGSVVRLGLDIDHADLEVGLDLELRLGYNP